LLEGLEAGRVHKKQRRLLLADPGIHIGILLPCHIRAYFTTSDGELKGVEAYTGR